MFYLSESNGEVKVNYSSGDEVELTLELDSELQDNESITCIVENVPEGYTAVVNYTQLDETSIGARVKIEPEGCESTELNISLKKNTFNPPQYLFNE